MVIGALHPSYISDQALPLFMISVGLDKLCQVVYNVFHSWRTVSA